LNQQLWQAHLDNQQLRQELTRLRARVKRQKLRDCAYCGRPTTSSQGVCGAHRDLPPLDPGPA